jgi:hypothetical protein
MLERLDEEELADWCAGRDAVYQLAALTVGARLAVADGEAPVKEKTPAGEPVFSGIRRSSKGYAIDRLITSKQLGTANVHIRE